jgi:hypothetical protein
MTSWVRMALKPWCTRHLSVVDQYQPGAERRPLQAGNRRTGRHSSNRCSPAVSSQGSSYSVPSGRMNRAVMCAGSAKRRPVLSGGGGSACWCVSQDRGITNNSHVHRENRDGRHCIKGRRTDVWTHAVETPVGPTTASCGSHFPAADFGTGPDMVSSEYGVAPFVRELARHPIGHARQGIQLS